MNKITRSQFEKLVGISKRPDGGFAKTLRGLSVGEGIMVKNSEWKYKTDFSQMCSVASVQARKLGVVTFATKTKRLADKSGFAVLRIS